MIEIEIYPEYQKPEEMEGFTAIGEYAFAEQTDLTEVRIPDSVKKLGERAFSGCTDLRSVIMPEGLTEIGQYAFSGCTSLSEVTIPDTVRKIGLDAFAGTPWLRQQKGPFVLAGDHVLVDYIGSEAEACFPEETKHIDYAIVSGWHSIRKLTYRGVTLDTDLLGNGSLRKALFMLKERKYTESIKYSAKYPILWRLFCADPEDAELCAYIRRHLVDMLQFAISQGDMEVVEAVCKDGTLLSRRNIDQLLEYAIEEQQVDIQMKLMVYKDQRIGFKTDPLNL